MVSASKTPEIISLAELGEVHVTSVRDVSAEDFIKAYAQHLKKSSKFTLPEWIDVVKTGSGKELPPLNPDWYYVRAASIARKIYLNGGIGVGTLAHWYGGAAKKGNGAWHFRKASRGLIRHILINLQNAGTVELTENGGRRITSEGQMELDTIARTIV